MIFNTGASGGSNAEQINYDNTESGLEATDVQGAIDELNTDISSLLKVGKAGTTSAFNVGKNWAQVSYTPPTGYKVVSVTGYFGTPTAIQCGGFFVANNIIYVAYNCFTAGTYALDLTVLLAKEELLG